MDYYGSAISLMYIAFFECIAIVWLYGVKRLSVNIRDMTGSYPNPFFRYCWLILSPLLIFAIWDDLEWKAFIFVNEICLNMNYLKLCDEHILEANKDLRQED